MASVLAAPAIAAIVGAAAIAGAPAASASERSPSATAFAAVDGHGSERGRLARCAADDAAVVVAASSDCDLPACSSDPLLSECLPD
jgi:orotate phosphoribosyltransferase